MLILISDPFDASLPGLLSPYGEVTDDAGRLAQADVVLVRSRTKCTKEYIDSAKNLKLIIRGGVGIDNIDVEYAKSKGIVVRNTPRASAIAVAELAFALMISVPNHLVEMDTSMKRGEWLKKTKRTELYGKTLALIGMGNIASILAARAEAFGMRVVAYDKFVKESKFATMMDSPEEAVRYADYISLHLPLTDETKGMVCNRLLGACTKKPVLINTGRGLCVDAECVAQALKDGKLSWYTTDVYPSDPPAPDYPLLHCERVTLTPHIGANSVENLLRIGDEVVTTIDELVRGGAL